MRFAQKEERPALVITVITVITGKRNLMKRSIGIFFYVVIFRNLAYTVSSEFTYIERKGQVQGMKKTIPIGKEDFKKIIEENSYYVDKMQEPMTVRKSTMDISLTDLLLWMQESGIQLCNSSIR